MNRLNGIAEFVATVECKSFVVAAQRVGMTPSGVSKAVSRLERRLGTRLLSRTTRSVSLTPDGATFYQRCHQILVELRDAEHLVGGASKHPMGRLRVELPPALGRLYVMPMLPQFAMQHADVSVEVAFREQFTDLYDEGADVALRIGGGSGPGLITRELGMTQHITCASPGYLARFGVPGTPADLLQRNCLASVSAVTGKKRDWHFSQAGKPFRLAVDGALSMSNTDGLIQAAASGVGITQVMDFVARRAIQEGSLKQILLDWTEQPRAISIIYLASRRESPRVKAFVEFVSALFPL